jgi:hypothetical protein
MSRPSLIGYGLGRDFRNAEGLLVELGRAPVAGAISALGGAISGISGILSENLPFLGNTFRAGEIGLRANIGPLGFAGPGSRGSYGWGRQDTARAAERAQRQAYRDHIRNLQEDIAEVMQIKRGRGEDPNTRDMVALKEWQRYLRGNPRPEKVAEFTRAVGREVPEWLASAAASKAAETDRLTKAAGISFTSGAEAGPGARRGSGASVAPDATNDTIAITYDNGEIRRFGRGDGVSDAAWIQMKTRYRDGLNTENEQQQFQTDVGLGMLVQTGIETPDATRTARGPAPESGAF